MAPWIHNDGPLSATPWPIPLIFGCPHMFSLVLDSMEILLETPEIYTMWFFSNEVLFMKIAKDNMNGMKQPCLLCNIIWTENKIWQVNLVHLLSFFNIQDGHQLHGHSKVDLLLQSLWPHNIPAPHSKIMKNEENHLSKPSWSMFRDILFSMLIKKTVAFWLHLKAKIMVTFCFSSSFQNR